MTLHKSVVLIGMMGSGKSTIAEIIAKKNKVSLISLDDQIVKLSNKSIPEIFAQDGEQQFRVFETQALETAINSKPSIIDAGGGVVETPKNRKLLSGDNVICCYLEVPIEILCKRVDNQGSRPLLVGKDVNQRLSEIHKKRQKWYKDTADMVIDASASAKKVATELQSKIWQ